MFEQTQISGKLTCCLIKVGLCNNLFLKLILINPKNNAFNDNLFPVDVFWMDIEYARDKAYFNFDVDKFPQDKLLEMNQLI